MTSDESATQVAPPGGSLFVTTRWSVVLAARDPGGPEAGRALETLCGTYWYPLYALVRGSGYSPHDAQDLTQSFFAALLAKDYLRVVTPEKGRFRTFLRMAMKRFLLNEGERLRSQKRGGGQVLLPLDTELAEQRFQQDAAGPHDVDASYDRRWALALLDAALSRLQQEYAQGGRAAEFALLKPYLTTERGQIPYAEIAMAGQTSEGAARVAIHRLRKRFREVFRAVIADTVAEPGAVASEIREVLAVLGSIS